MWFEDLSPCTYFESDATLIAVGWLERGKPYATGEADRRLYDALAQLATDPWQPATSCGVHECDLCRFVGAARSAANLFIPGERVIYVSPAMILHYMNAHGCAPPAVFANAVLACPPMRSMQYLKAIAAAGGAALLRTSPGLAP